MKVSVLGIDLAKNVFQLHGVDQGGKAVLRKKITRGQLIAQIRNQPPCLIGMEACPGAHYWAREFKAVGHTVKLIAPQFVKPYVKSNKSDRADAEAICEAVTRPNMRFVPIKQIEQQDIQMLHRIRERVVKSRTALANEIRGLLHEFGIIIPQGFSRLTKDLPSLLVQEESKFSPMSRKLFEELLQELRVVSEKLEHYNAQIESIHQAHPVSQKLAEIPGVGVVTATAILAAVSDPSAFKNGRELSAWLGLVPKQHSTGGKERLLGISKRGDPYLRTLLIHGARACIWHLGSKMDRRSIWARKLVERRGTNRATVALANKNARVIWALLARGGSYEAYTG